MLRQFFLLPQAKGNAIDNNKQGIYKLSQELQNELGGLNAHTRKKKKRFRILEN